MANEVISLSDLFTIEKFAARHAHILNERMLRYQMRNRCTNGLSRAVVRVGRRTLISETRYQEWLTETAERASE